MVSAALMERLRDAHTWLFDMDGTLTVAAHDFDAMRDTLGLPAGRPILESLEAMPADEQREKRAALDALELEMAADSQPQPDARALLDGLAERGLALGIVTRNGRQIADATLAAAGLDGYFRADAIISRDCAVPKPDPAGVTLALDRLANERAAEPARSVMVGDYLFDLAAGRAAGCMTVHLDVAEGETWPHMTDVRVRSLRELVG